MSKQRNTIKMKELTEAIKKASGLTIFQVYKEEYGKDLSQYVDEKIEALSPVLPEPGDKPDQYVETTTRLLTELSTNEAIRSLFSIKMRDKYYERVYKVWRGLLEKGATWGDLLQLYREGEASPPLAEVFLSLVEELEGEVHSLRDIQELTKIKPPKLRGTLLPRRTLITLHKQHKRETSLLLSYLYSEAHTYRYVKALEFTLDNGGKYKDLQEINTKGAMISEAARQSLIEQVIGKTFNLDNTETRPNLRAIAKVLGAPYSVILRAYVRNWLNVGVNR